MRFDLIRIISTGCKSEVQKCLDHGKGQDSSSSLTSTFSDSVRVVAIKIISNKEKAFEEVGKLLLVGHHNIITIVDIVEDVNGVGIVIPFVHMDLRSFMGCMVYSTSLMAQIKLQIMEAVHHIHTRGILHMDIKPENICIDFVAPDVDSKNKVHCLLLDFGSSVVVEEMLHVLNGSDSSLSTIHSTRGYLSPELTSHGILSSACDIFSAGVVFSELAEHRHRDCGEPIQLSVLFNQLSLDMRHDDFRRRPSSREVLLRLGGENTGKPLLPLLQHNASSPAWTSPVASMLISQCGRQRCSVAGVFINDHLSTNLQKLVTLVRSSDVGHIRDAFWLLFQSSIEEVDQKSNDCGLSVLSILHYFDSRIYLANEHSFFYAKSLDILSHLPYFVLSDDMKLHLWKVSSTSRSCERPVIRCLAKCWNAELSSWCADDRKRWGASQDEFKGFVERFVGDWDMECAKAARVVLDQIVLT